MMKSYLRVAVAVTWIDTEKARFRFAKVRRYLSVALRWRWQRILGLGGKGVRARPVVVAKL
jgi:hypothetical protein